MAVNALGCAGREGAQICCVMGAPRRGGVQVCRAVGAPSHRQGAGGCWHAEGADRLAGHAP
eukprot:scaffold217586_cov19-Tisochrysis_lutea.AAC.1